MLEVFLLQGATLATVHPTSEDTMLSGLGFLDGTALTVSAGSSVWCYMLAKLLPGLCL